MAINEIISIFDKIANFKTAAPAALASLILFIPCGFAFTIIFLVKLHSIRPIPDGRAMSIILTEIPHGLSITALALLTILITSLCFLVVDIIRDLGSRLKVINSRLGISIQRKIKKEKAFIGRAKRIRLLCNEEIEERAQIIRMFHPDTSVVNLSTDFNGRALASLESDNLVRIAYCSNESGRTYIRLNSQYEFLIRAFLDKELDRLIKIREEEFYIAYSFLIAHDVFTTFFDYIYYPIAYSLVLFIMLSFIGLLLPVFSIFS